jgi:hypothetical protein
LSREKLEKFYISQGELHTMENFAVRSFVLVLALVGFGATTVTSSANVARALEAKTSAQVPSVVTTPTPVCVPGKSTCGMD